MTNDILKGKWKQLRGSIKSQWGKLTDDDLDRIEGNRDRLVGRLQEAYGKGKMDAERELDEFLSKQDRGRSDREF